jgi:hypothetical protein
MVMLMLQPTVTERTAPGGCRPILDAISGLALMLGTAGCRTSDAVLQFLIRGPPVFRWPTRPASSASS